MYADVCICMYMYVYVCICICMYMFVDVCICMYICIYWRQMNVLVMIMIEDDCCV